MKLSCEQVFAALPWREELEYSLPGGVAPYRAPDRSRFDDAEFIALFADIVRRMKTNQSVSAAMRRPGFQKDFKCTASLSATDFLKEVRAKAKSLKIDADMLKRPVNVGFSGGEKKRNEILQMAMLEPKMCILDETDSGLDVDAMKLVAEGVNALRDDDRGFLVITHYQRLLDHIKPDVVHILANGRIVKTGGPELALEVENNGYADILAEVE